MVATILVFVFWRTEMIYYSVFLTICFYQFMQRCLAFLFSLLTSLLLSLHSLRNFSFHKLDFFLFFCSFMSYFSIWIVTEPAFIYLFVFLKSQISEPAHHCHLPQTVTLLSCLLLNFTISFTGSPAERAFMEQTS